MTEVLMALVLQLSPKILFYEGGSLTDQCSSFAVTERYLVTAAHCLPTAWLTQESDNLSQAVALRSDTQDQVPLKLKRVGHYFIKNQGMNEFNAAEDWAIFELEVPLKKSQVFFEIESRMEFNNISIFGYPWTASQFERYHSQHHCKILSESKSSFQTDCQGSPGMSGGPMFMISPDGRLLIVGIINHITVGKRRLLSGVPPSPSLRDAVEELLRENQTM